MFGYAPLLIRTHLAGALPGVHVGTEVPNPRPQRLVRLRTAPAGPSGNDALTWRRLIVECWAPTELEAGRLAENVREQVMDSRYARIGVRAVRVVGEPALFPDPETDTPRTQFTVDVLLRDQPPH